ncbi:MAG: WG repeat-containing protein [Clostridia bacterium]
MSRGRRYDSDNKKLNLKKVFAVIIALVVIIMFGFIIKELMSPKPASSSVDKVAATYFYPVFTNNKWGVIDGTGKIIIQPTYEEMIVIPDNQKTVFVAMEEVNKQTGEFKTKVLNEKNETIFTEYEKIEPIENFDANQNLWYEKNVLRVSKDGKYGLIDLDGKLILPCEYDNITAMRGITNSLLTTKENQLGLVDNTGSVIIQNAFKEIKPLTSTYENGYIVINNENKYGVIGYNKKQVLENVYEDIKSVYGSNKYVVKQDGKWSLVNEKAEVLLNDGFDDITEINGDNITFVKDNKYGVMSISKEIKIEAKYETLSYAFGDYYIAKQQDKYGIVSASNEEKIPFEYQELSYRKETDLLEGSKDGIETDLIDRQLQVKLTGIISEINTEKGYIKIRVGEEYKYYNFKLEEKKNTEILTSNTLFLSKQDGKYGFVNKEGVVVVNYIYDDATEVNKFGFAAVKKDGVWGCIDQKGNIIVDTKYNLDYNLKIDFIGTYHLGEDLNVNYYTDK